MRKRVLGLLLVSCLLLTTGCGDKENKETKKDEKQENTIKTISCVNELEKSEIEKDENGNSIMGIQGQKTEYKYDTKKNELTEVTASIYVKFENASEDYISKQAEESKVACDAFKDDDTVKNCEIKKDGDKVEVYMVADIDNILDGEDISKTATFEDIEKYVKEESKEDGLTCTVN